MIVSIPPELGACVVIGLDGADVSSSFGVLFRNYLNGDPILS